MLLDIETSPNRAYVWGLFNVNIAINQIEESGETLCWAAKWLGEKEVMFSSIMDGKKKMLRQIYKLLEEADVVIHYNGSRFDIPTLAKEFVLMGWAPPAPFQQVDLLSVVRKRFKFPSNKLNYVSQALGLGEKVAHRGLDLWKECMAKEKEAWKEMETYNIQDVNLLEKLYEKLKAWITGHPNYALFSDGEKPVCPNCGSEHLQRRGFHRTKTMTYQRFQCQDCHAWSKERTATMDKEQKKSVLAGI